MSVFGKAALGSILMTTTLTAVSPVMANGPAMREANDAIARGDWRTAEQRLVAEQRIFPQRAEVLLNLAAVYANTSRPAQARDLYRQVLSSDDVVMDLSGNRTASAHDVAETGLRRIVATQTAAR